MQISGGSSGFILFEEFTGFNTAETRTITAFKQPGYAFRGWEQMAGTCTITDTSATKTDVTVPSRKSCEIRAKFAPANYLIVTSDNSAWGLVQAATGTTGAVSQTTLGAGANQKIQANAYPNTGYVFDDWELTPGSCTLTDDACTLPAGSTAGAACKIVNIDSPTQDCNLKAKFKVGSATITLQGSHVSFSLASATANANEEKSFTANPATNYAFGSASVTSGPCTITQQPTLQATTAQTIKVRMDPSPDACTVTVSMLPVHTLNLNPEPNAAQGTVASGTTSTTEAQVSVTRVGNGNIDFTVTNPAGYHHSLPVLTGSGCSLNGNSVTFTSSTATTCNLVVNFIAYCPDGTINNGEACDGSVFPPGDSCTSATRKYKGGTLLCSPGCNQILETNCNGYSLGFQVTPTGSGTATNTTSGTGVNGKFKLGDSIGITTNPSNALNTFNGWSSNNANCIITNTGSQSTSVTVGADCTLTASYGLCGNGVIDLVTNEICDPNSNPVFSSDPQTCYGLGYKDGTLRCMSNCQQKNEDLCNGYTVSFVNSPSGYPGDAKLSATPLHKLKRNVAYPIVATKAKSSDTFVGWSKTGDCTLTDAGSLGASVTITGPDICSLTASFNTCENGDIDTGYGEICDSSATPKFPTTTHTCYQQGYKSSPGERTCTSCTTVSYDSCTQYTVGFSKQVAGGGNPGNPGFSSAQNQITRKTYSIAANPDTAHGYFFISWTSSDNSKCSIANPLSPSTTFSLTDDCILTAHYGICGNGVPEGTEICDGNGLKSQNCQTLGFQGGTLACKNDCTAFETSQCHQCGNSQVNLDKGEQCDNSNLDNNVCSSIGLGFTDGSLSCKPVNDPEQCRFETSMCTTCGNGIKEYTEDCDLTDFGSPAATCHSVDTKYHGGVLGCYSHCAYDVHLCTYCGDGTCQYPREDYGSCSSDCGISSSTNTNIENTAMIGGLAILASLSLAGLMYMGSQVFSSLMLVSMAKTEVGSAIGSIAILSLILGGYTIFDSIASTLTVPIEGVEYGFYGMIERAALITGEWLAGISGIQSALFGLISNYATESSKGLYCNFLGVGMNLAYCSVFQFPIGAMNSAHMAVTTVGLAMTSQYAILAIGREFGLFILFLGIFLRSFLFTRGIGNTLCALFIGLCLIYPLMIIAYERIYQELKASIVVKYPNLGVSPITKIGSMGVSCNPENLNMDSNINAASRIADSSVYEPLVMELLFHYLVGNGLALFAFLGSLGALGKALGTDIEAFRLERLS